MLTSQDLGPLPRLIEPVQKFCKAWVSGYLVARTSVLSRFQLPIRLSVLLLTSSDIALTLHCHHDRSLTPPALVSESRLPLVREFSSSPIYWNSFLPPKDHLIIDTGSSNTWIGAGASYVKTSTSQSTGKSVSVKYGSGSFNGTECKHIRIQFSSERTNVLSVAQISIPSHCPPASLSHRSP